ncbi:DUF2867 domain-containing protein [Microvirga tunisiensis]|uniref:DUF2867 domain-containing protein n=1 Tax=Pannonibacter tanglangensis TaxID=2750084 RepID=A0A7X5F079_9HYPH|nr:DUF2867 domain-containing protein [Pannonibacter sp. XCT-53]NBN77375.1 DUF2867 domain-containing protein [Pannonibacter sp. XCT-53]
MPTALPRDASARPFLMAPREELHFYDRRSVHLARAVTALDGWKLMRSQPSVLLDLAMRLRDAIACRFGVAPIRGFAPRVPAGLRAGDRLGFFTVDHVSDTDLVLTVRDRHLDVMTWLAVDGLAFSVTSSVRVHNLFGRLYMLPVAPAHKLIVAADLRRLRRLVGSPGKSDRQI